MSWETQNKNTEPLVRTAGPSLCHRWSERSAPLLNFVTDVEHFNRWESFPLPIRAGRSETLQVRLSFTSWQEWSRATSPVTPAERSCQIEALHMSVIPPFFVAQKEYCPSLDFDSWQRVTLLRLLWEPRGAQRRSPTRCSCLACCLLRWTCETIM